MPNQLCSIKNKNFWLIPFLVLLTVAFIVTPVASKIYKWKDETGKTYYTDSPAKIPKKYRDNDKRIETVREGPVDATNPVRINLTGNAGRVIEVPLIDTNGSFYAEVNLNGKVKASLLVDTGASIVTLSQKIVKLLGYNSYSNLPKIPFSTAGGTVMSPLVTIKSMNVGGAKLRDVEANINPHMGELDGLLGMTFLGEYKVEVDKKASVMRLKPLHDRGDALWDGKNADWWKTRLTDYSKKAWQSNRGASYFKKDNPKKSREMKRLSDYYQKLYDNLNNRAKRAGLPAEHIPPPLRHD
ncbi:MAG: TIGR02281 family clan AA aspartic protease [Nitrospinales bacterium]